jgi:hypothetical protein
MEMDFAQCGTTRASAGDKCWLRCQIDKSANDTGIATYFEFVRRSHA